MITIIQHKYKVYSLFCTDTLLTDEKKSISCCRNAMIVFIDFRIVFIRLRNGESVSQTNNKKTTFNYIIRQKIMKLTVDDAFNITKLQCVRISLNVHLFIWIQVIDEIAKKNHIILWFIEIHLMRRSENLLGTQSENIELRGIGYARRQ